MVTNNNPKIIKVKELLENSCLKIPSYQRPYKWTLKNVNQLIDDIFTHKDKSEYRLGTIVIHHHDNDYDIVDGQQRTITLTLIAYAIRNAIKNDIVKINKNTRDGMKLSDSFNSILFNPSFNNDLSKRNILNNYKQIERRILDFDENSIWFFLEKCTLVEVVLNDISEAFQFFDSQNSRGKDLEPHDLLKAFHLREMNNYSTEEERKKIVEKWESWDSAKLSRLFSQYLFRIRNWSKGYSARYFSKNDVDVFKGVTPSIEENYPFTSKLRIVHFYVDEYNNSYHRKIDKKKMVFPFQIDETIINGKRFFELIEYYQVMIDNIKSLEMSEKYPLLNVINTYEGHFRTGDKYIRNLFYCGLIYYIDKFGDNDLSKAIDKIFIWAYSLRLKLQAVGLDSVDNYALNNSPYSQINLFNIISEAISPRNILNIRLEIIKENRSSKTEEIVDKFKILKYYE